MCWVGNGNGPTWNAKGNVTTATATTANSINAVVVTSGVRQNVHR